MTLAPSQKPLAQTRKSGMFTIKSPLALAVMAATVSLAQTTPVLAEAATESAYKKYQPTLMNQVTVTASRSEKQVKDIAGSVSVIDSETIERNLNQDISDLVKYEPGVSTVGGGGRFGISGFNIRGMDENRVKIMVDGQSTANSFSNGTYLNAGQDFVDIETLKSVEVIKGPSSTLHGSDAMAGTVAYVTKDPSDLLKSSGDETAASVSSRYSSANQGFTNTASMANRTDDVESMLIYTNRQAKETETHGGLDINGNARGEADSLDIGTHNLLGKVAYQVDENNHIKLTAEHYRSNVDSDLKSKIDYAAPPFNILYDKYTSDDEKVRSRLTFEHEWWADKKVFDTLKWTVGWQDTETLNKTELNRVDNPMSRYRESEYNELNWSGSVQFDKEFSIGETNHVMVYGFDGAWKEIDSLRYLRDISNTDGSVITDNTLRDFPNSEQYTAALFMQDEISMLNDQFKVIPGLRYDYNKIKTSPDALFIENDNPNAEAETTTFDHFTAKLGAVYDLNDSVSMFAQYAQGFRAPQIHEMYMTLENASYEQRANPDLKPETSDNFELGLRADNQTGNVELVTFYSKYDDFIENIIWDEGGIDVYQNQNLAKVTVKGVELKGMLDLAAFSPAAEGFMFRGSVTWADGEYENPNEPVKPLNSIAPMQAVLGLGYDAPEQNWGGDMSLTLVSSKNSDDIDYSEAEESRSEGEQFATPGYGLVDLTAYYVPMDDITVRAGLFNVTDKKYWAWNDVRGTGYQDPGLDRYTQPGRNFSVSVKWDI